MWMFSIRNGKCSIIYCGSYLRVRTGACFLVIANQEREKAGLDNPQSHDSEESIKVAIEGIRNMIKLDKKKAAK